MSAVCISSSPTAMHADMAHNSNSSCNSMLLECGSNNKTLIYDYNIDNGDMKIPFISCGVLIEGHIDM